jgi:acetoin utilization deacetylase AcuC-like enzyme
VGLRTPVVWSEHHRLHEPGGEVWVGVRTPGTEVPERAERIRAELEGAGAPIHEGPLADPDAELAAVHERELLDYLGAAWNDWEAAGLTEEPGQDRVVPYIFPLAELLPDRPAATPAAVSARAGRFTFDTMTLVGPGTWEAAHAAAATAVTAADLVLGGEPAAYACCRPPGHHAARACFGGSCYLNNAAVAAARLRAQVKRVAVLDIDAHHGNGTQSIFYANPGVLVGSVHVDPGAGWFPHFLGFADETGSGVGAGANRNVPVAPGAGDDPWLEAVAGLAEWARAGGAAALVVPLGVDAAGGDPESPLEVTASGFRAAGRVLGELRLPTVVVQEGGYDLDTLGELVRETLIGLEEGLGR